MNHFDIEDALSSMVILIDTREQENESFKKRIASFPCPSERQKLDFGDYSAKCVLPNGAEFSLKSKISIERKMSLDELAGNFGTNRKRFEREFERMKDANGKMYLLCENGSYEKILMHMYRSRFSPKAYIASLFAWMARYDLKVIFCNEANSPKLLYEILFRELKEQLENLEEGDGDNGSR